MHAITNIQKFSIHDGDGIRTTVFFKGCPLRCVWCHNPETQSFESELQTDISKCTGCGRCRDICPKSAITISEDGTASTDRAECKVCGKCEDVCPAGCRTLVGRNYSVRELVAKCLQDQMFYEESGGGVTLSGGEVMAMDTDYVQAVVRALHREGIRVAIDTCGQAPYSCLEAVERYVDTWLYDIKVMDEEIHRKYIGTDNRQILDNLIRLSASGARIYIRIPVVREVNGSREAMSEIIDFLRENNIRPQQINLLPYHSTGSHKYSKLGMQYGGGALTAPDDTELREFVSQWKDAGFTNIRIGG